MGTGGTTFQKAVDATKSLETNISTAIVSETTTVSTALSTMVDDVTNAINQQLSNIV
jgi:hypothetical protein